MAGVNLSSMSRKVRVKTNLNRLLRIASLGDSTADSSNLTTTNTDSYVISFPSEGQTSYATVRGHSVPCYMKIPSILVANGGIAGQQSSQLIARSIATPSSTRKAVQDVISNKPDVVFLRISTNDISSLVTASSNHSVIDGIINRHLIIAKSLIAYGIDVIDCGCFGYSAPVSSELLAVRRAAIVEVNSAVKEWSAKYSKHHFLDVEGVLSIAGAYISGCSDDGVHLNAIGGARLGELEYATVSEIFDVSQTDQFIYDGTTDFQNSTNGTPEKFFVDSSGVTVNSKKSDISGFTANITVTSETNTFRLYSGSPSSTAILANLLANDQFHIDCYVEVYDENSEKQEFILEEELVLKPSNNSSFLRFQLVTAGAVGNANYAHQCGTPVAYAGLGSQCSFYVGTKNLPVGTYTVYISPVKIRRYAP